MYIQCMATVPVVRGKAPALARWRYLMARTTMMAMTMGDKNCRAGHEGDKRCSAMLETGR